MERRSADLSWCTPSLCRSILIVCYGCALFSLIYDQLNPGKCVLEHLITYWYIRDYNLYIGAVTCLNACDVVKVFLQIKLCNVSTYSGSLNSCKYILFTLFAHFPSLFSTLFRSDSQGHTMAYSTGHVCILFSGLYFSYSTITWVNRISWHLARKNVSRILADADIFRCPTIITPSYAISGMQIFSIEIGYRNVGLFTDYYSALEFLRGYAVIMIDLVLEKCYRRSMPFSGVGIGGTRLTWHSNRW